MGKITKEAINAFNNGIKYNNSNTRVDVYNWNGSFATAMYLFGNLIAERFDSTGLIRIINCGHFTKTTKERLNAIDGVNIVQKKGVWYLNGKEWDGGLIEIK